MLSKLDSLIIIKIAAMIAVTAVILLIQANGVYGKMGPITSVKGVIHCGIALTVLLYLIICYCV